MIVRCERCTRTYDDGRSWTICPHGPLEVAPDQYCRVHDLARPYQPKAFDELGCPHGSVKTMARAVGAAAATRAGESMLRSFGAGTLVTVEFDCGNAGAICDEKDAEFHVEQHRRTCQDCQRISLGS
ncbi:MAG: hypothetical protein ACREIS_05695 [Nitrospiraceae bacterium]